MSSAHAAAAYRSHEAAQPAQLVERHFGLVGRIASYLASRLPDSVELDDLMQAGMIGLIEASRNFRTDQGASFETYASIRIRGSMIDEVRKGDWVPRSVHRQYRDIIAATRRIEQSTGLPATEQQIAKAVGMTLPEYHKALEESSRGQLISLEMHIETKDGEGRAVGCSGSSPSQDFSRASFQKSLADAIKSLPPREQMVLSLYYEQELNLREIGATLEISESRVCQIHGAAVLRLRSRLRDWEIDDALNPGLV